MNWADEIWFNENKLNTIREMLRSGYEIYDGYVRLVREKAVAYETPWVFVGQTGVTCEFRNHIYWQKFNLIPSYCRTRCYKLVAKANNVAELMKLHLLMKQIYGMHGFGGKCGVDTRWFNPGAWAGFWYNDGLEAGQKCYEVVHEAISVHIDPKWADDEDRLFLKKACTEMEHPIFKGTPSNTWGEATAEDLELENTLENIFRPSPPFNLQPPWLENKIIYDWIKMANSINDKSYLEFTADIAPTVTIKYHRKIHEAGGDAQSDLALVGALGEGETSKGGK